MEHVPRSSAGLGSAWNADPRPSTPDPRPLPPFAPSAPRTSKCFHPVRVESPSLSPHAFATRVPVLIACCPSCASTLLGLDLLASRHRPERMYSVEHAQMNSICDLEACCRQQAPRLLLVDIALLSPEGIGKLGDLRRHFPATDWLLGWEQPSAKGLDAAIRIQARGCVEWEASAEQFAQSLDAVLAGILGFPGPVLQALYLSVLRWTVAGGRPASGSTPPAIRLTAREDEVLSLMHRDLSNKQIAEQLGISVNTVKKHLAHVFAKQGQHSRRWHLARPGLAEPVLERFIPQREPAAPPYPADRPGQLARIAYRLEGAGASPLACPAGQSDVLRAQAK